MKHASHNEVDLLLRSFARARGEGTGPRNGQDAGAPGNHLDADELNSYAEGVVPAPARARYTEHLADCDECRGMVIQLTSAAGAVTRTEVTEQKGAPSFWAILGSVFTPAVLRFAVPALIVTAVIGIALLATRQQRQPEFVAQNQPVDLPKSVEQPQRSESTNSDSTGVAPPIMQKQAQPRASAEPFKERNNLEAEKRSVAEGAGTGAGEVASIVREKDAGEREEQPRKLEARPSYAPEPKAAPAPGTLADNEAEKSAVLAKQQAATRDDRDRQREGYKDVPSDEHGPNRSAAQRTATAPASNRRLDGLTAGRGGPYTQAKKDKSGDVETRTVAGRHFAREGNAWVDTAYDPSRTPVRVARGSEQFRALVADEPGLRTIAAQLNGVVIVVWKNRAYRIQ